MGKGVPEGKTETPFDTPEIVWKAGFDEVERRLRSVTLLKNSVPGFCPYRRSEISLARLSPDSIKPAALYVLNPVLERTRMLRIALLPQGVDILHMQPDRSIIKFIWGDEEILMSPPIVEESEDDGNVLVVTDGLHRLAVARNDGDDVEVVLIRHIAVPLQPLPVSWDEVRRVEVVPPGSQKKRFRFSTKREMDRWIEDHYDRFLDGFDFPEQLGYLHGLAENP